MMKYKIWISEEELELYKTIAKEQSLGFTKKCMYTYEDRQTNKPIHNIGGKNN